MPIKSPRNKEVRPTYFVYIGCAFRIGCAIMIMVIILYTWTHHNFEYFHFYSVHLLQVAQASTFANTVVTCDKFNKISLKKNLPRHVCVKMKKKRESKKKTKRKHEKNRKVSTIEALKRVRRFLLYFHASWLALELLLFSSTFDINFNIKERTMLLFFLLFLVIHSEYTIIYHLHINVWNVHIKAKKQTKRKKERRSQKLQKLISNKRQSELNVRGIVYLSAYP